MGVHSGDSMEWTEDCEKYLLENLAERVKRDPNGAPIFKGTNWQEVDEQIFMKFALRYGHERVKAKYHRLRSMHTKFNELINHTGVTWDSTSGQVFANDTVWDELFKRDRIFKSFKKKGCKIYSLLSVVFSNSTASGTFHNASTCAPQTSEEERRILCAPQTTQRIISDRFQHSTGTVHFWFKIVLRALKAFDITVVKTVDRGEVQPEIQANSRWYPFFKNCIGAIDGTHVAAWAPLSKQKSFRGRKAVLVTQKVMAICSHDMMFTFVYAGWEGTANDSRVFYDAVIRPENKFPIPTGDHFYVVDSGYPNLKGFLAPYRGERYHRSDFQRVGRVLGKKELFNFMHSSVRNVIERAFGVLKKRFHILQDIPSYPLRRQMLIPHACCALHNYIRMEDKADTLFTTYGDENLPDLQESLQVVQEGFPLDMTGQDEMLQVRDSIADMLWEKYIQRRQR